MALHERDSVRDNLLDDLYASSELSARIPKYKFPEEEHAPRHVRQIVHDEVGKASIFKPLVKLLFLGYLLIRDDPPSRLEALWAGDIL